MNQQQEVEINTEDVNEDDLHEIFRQWEQLYTTPSFNPEPFVRR
jgi:hypothetical protein